MKTPPAPVSQRGAALLIVLVLTALLSMLAATQMRILGAGAQVALQARRGEQALQAAQLALRQCEQLALQGASQLASTSSSSALPPEPTDPPRWGSAQRWAASPDLVRLPGGAECLIETLALWQANPPPHCAQSPCPPGQLPPWSRVASAGRLVTVRAAPMAGSVGTSGPPQAWLQSTLMLSPSGAPVSSTLKIIHRSWRPLMPQ
ncbi:MAG: hypothetical protein EBU07_15230 [Betaproteobacteria bacterium]|nr:hypothetical protein [Betaproteobacteria bacterium]NBS46581.1 hypothetical protein [Betaproteobacteria bacterium]